MRYGKCYPIYIPLLLLVSGLAFTGCRKENGIDNNNIIETPYGLFFGDKLGAMYSTNNGLAYKLLFPADGYTDRTITTSGNNIIMVKKNLHISDNGGKQFNAVNYTVNQTPQWQSMILDVPSQGRVYVTSTKPKGLEYSEDNGATWQTDVAWDPQSAATSVQSLTMTSDGKVYTLDNVGPHIYVRGTKADVWKEDTMVTALPAGQFYLSHFNNILLAADYKGSGGVWFSNDGGVNWTAYNGVPTNQKIFSIHAPLGQTVLIGTDSAGIFRLDGTTFTQSNNGLKPFTSVYGITGKQDTYKNQIIRQYVYIATNNGLFRSEDLGQNWTLVKTGDYRNVY